MLADGARASSADADLFWALRGAGGGRFGVVTALEFATVPGAGDDRVRDVLGRPRGADRAWQAWAPDAPDALAASLLITAAPARR